MSVYDGYHRNVTMCGKGDYCKRGTPPVLVQFVRLRTTFHTVLYGQMKGVIATAFPVSKDGVGAETSSNPQVYSRQRVATLGALSMELYSREFRMYPFIHSTGSRSKTRSINTPQHIARIYLITVRYRRHSVPCC